MTNETKKSLTCYEKNKKHMDLLRKAFKTSCDDLQLQKMICMRVYVLFQVQSH